MIYFVDEDVSQIGQWTSILRMKGFETEVIGDADTALEHLSKCEDIQLVFIDVMLAASPFKKSRYFTRARTKDYQITGLELLNALVGRRPEMFPSRAILLSQAARTKILKEIENTVIEYGQNVEYWRKIDFESLLDFAKRTEETLKLRGFL